MPGGRDAWREGRQVVNEGMAGYTDFSCIIRLVEHFNFWYLSLSALHHQTNSMEAYITSILYLSFQI